MGDPYIDNVSNYSGGIKFVNYLVLLEQENPINLIRLLPTIQKQLIIYIDDINNIYLSEISGFGKFSKPKRVDKFYLNNCKNDNYSFECAHLGIEGKYRAVRIGNTNVFDSMSTFINFLESKNINED